MKITKMHSGDTVHLNIDTDDGALLLHTVSAGMTPDESLRSEAASMRVRIYRLQRSAARMEAAAEHLEQE